MAKATSKSGLIIPTLWAVFFAVCIGLAAAHLTQAVRGQAQQESSLIESTFTQVPKD
jgi:hypothetical protein